MQSRIIRKIDRKQTAAETRTSYLTSTLAHTENDK